MITILNYSTTVDIISDECTERGIFYHNAFDYINFDDGRKVVFCPAGDLTDEIWKNFFNDYEIDYSIGRLSIVYAVSNRN